MPEFQLSNEEMQRKAEILKTTTRVATEVGKMGDRTLEEKQHYSVKTTEKENELIDKLFAEENIKDLTKQEVIRLENVKERNMSHLLVNDTKVGGDSDLMDAVKKSIMALETQLSTTFANETSIKRTQKAYEDAIKACRDYVDGRNPISPWGKRRKRKVEARLEKLREELKWFERGANAVRDGRLNRPKTNNGLIVDEKEKMRKAEAGSKNTYKVLETNIEFLKQNLPDYEGGKGFELDEDEKALFMKALSSEVVYDALTEERKSIDKDTIKYAIDFSNTDEVFSKDVMDRYLEIKKSCMYSKGYNKNPDFMNAGLEHLKKHLIGYAALKTVVPKLREYDTNVGMGHTSLRKLLDQLETMINDCREHIETIESVLRKVAEGSNDYGDGVFPGEIINLFKG